MTTEEAIDYNKNLRMYMRLSDKNQPYKFLEENYIALDIAIKALEQEPCEDAISRKEVIETIEWYDKDRYIECSNDMIEYIKKMPSVKPQQKIGRWIDGFGGCECSECGCLEAGHSDYCPNCGAKMEEVEE